MQIVIDIPDFIYTEIRNITENTGIIEHNAKALYNAIYYGTPLPEQHGRLVDADWVKNTLDIYVINEYNGQFIRRNDIDSVPTIIEADKESES